MNSFFVHIIQLRTSSDDQGSLDNDEEEEVASEESGNEGDDEHTEDTESFVKTERHRPTLPGVTVVQFAFINFLISL